VGLILLNPGSHYFFVIFAKLSWLVKFFITVRTQRLVESSEEIDHIENGWWNANSEVIEKIWAHSYALQWCIRYPYLKKAKSFLQTSEQEKKLIWEVGCGTGWVCRMIADKNFHIIGTDFSKAQIEKAIELAAHFGKEDYCSYRISDASTLVEGHDGVFIHALLHHLTEMELDGFFSVMEEQKQGTRVFLYEPVFVNSNSKKSAAAFLWKKMIKLYVKIVSASIRISGSKNEPLIRESQALFEAADKNGWFLSPKEVPFYEHELESRLNQYFTTRKRYFVNSSDFTIAQMMVLYNMDRPGFLFRKLVFPVATWLDTVFFKLNFRSVSKGEYFFCCYELIRK
jgi:2-polyprenyl-3-methyl-5-hydroxy-6-metoxy-1,4-benzoquinol methylase